MALDHLGKRAGDHRMARHIDPVLLVSAELRRLQRDLWIARRGHRLHDVDLDFGSILLFGAELYSEMEHQTAGDTTTGPEFRWARAAPRWPTRSARTAIRRRPRNRRKAVSASRSNSPTRITSREAARSVPRRAPRKRFVARLRVARHSRCTPYRAWNGASGRRSDARRGGAQQKCRGAGGAGLRGGIQEAGIVTGPWRRPSGPG